MVLVAGSFVTVSGNAGTLATATASCTGGKVLVGGSVSWNSPDANKVSRTASYPSSATTWTGTVVSNGNSIQMNIRAYALCANA